MDADTPTQYRPYIAVALIAAVVFAWLSLWLFNDSKPVAAILEPPVNHLTREQVEKMGPQSDQAGEIVTELVSESDQVGEQAAAITPDLTTEQFMYPAVLPAPILEEYEERGVYVDTEPEPEPDAATDEETGDGFTPAELEFILQHAESLQNTEPNN